MPFFITELLIIIFLAFFESILDIKTHKINLIPIFFSAITIFFLRSIEFSFSVSWIFILQGLILGSFYLVIYFSSKKKLGIGDIIFGAFSGICIYKWQFLWISIAGEVFAFLLFVLTLKLKKINLQNKEISFIPFMSAGLIIAFVLSYSL